MTSFTEERRSALGSTDSPAILGLSPWKSAHDVWLDKMGQAQEREPSLPMFLGTRLEGAIGELYTAETGIQVVRDTGHYVTPGGIVGAHIDFHKVGVNGLVEAKTARSKKGWGTELFSDDVPRNYWTQVQHQMACLPDVDHVDIAVLFGHQEFRIYRVPRHQAFIDSLVPDMEAWWQRHVVNNEPPPVDGSESSGRWLRETYPTELGTELMPATPEQQRLVEDLMLVRSSIASMERSEELLVQQLQDIIKTAPGMYGSKFVIRWKQNRSRVVVNWEAAFDLASTQLPQEQVKNIVASVTTIKEGARPFIVDRIEEDEHE